MKTTTLTLYALALLYCGLLSPRAATADGDGDQRSGRHERRATRTPAQPEAPSAGTANRAPNHHFPPNYYLNRPLGSAMNAPRGYYGDHLSYQPPVRHHDHASPAYYPQPVYYVVPPLFPDDDPLSFGWVRGPDDAVEPVSSEPLVIETDRVYVITPDRQPVAADAWSRPAAAEALAWDREPTYPVDHHPSAPPQAPEPRPTEPQWVALRIEPPEALVWIDDESLGSAGELDGLELEPGVYLLEVEHGQLPPQRLFFGVVDQPVDVRVDLSATEPRRRYRVR